MKRSGSNCLQPSGLILYIMRTIKKMTKSNGRMMGPVVVAYLT
jgi:hypothetical protein